MDLWEIGKGKKNFAHSFFIEKPLESRIKLFDGISGIYNGDNSIFFHKGTEVLKFFGRSHGGTDQRDLLKEQMLRENGGPFSAGPANENDAPPHCEHSNELIKIASTSTIQNEIKRRGNRAIPVCGCVIEPCFGSHLDGAFNLFI